MIGGRGRVERDRLLASQAPLQEAAGHLRSWCLAHVEEAEGERRQLLVRQVQGEFDADAAVQAYRAAEDRDRIRSAWATSRRDMVSQRDALAAGLGWPHRGEPVTVTTWRYGADGKKVTVSGEGIYLGDHDIYLASHQVWLPELSSRPHEGTVLVCWHTGPGDDRRIGPGGIRRGTSACACRLPRAASCRCC